MPSVWLLHNAQAGSPSYVRAVDRAAAALARRGVAVELVRHVQVQHLRQAARQAVAAAADAVLVAGGDGTLGAIAGELAHTPTALGALPAGTANVWARELGLPRPALGRPAPFERLAWLLLEAPAHPTDLGRCNGRWFLSWASVGLDAFVVEMFERQRETARRAGGFLYNAVLAFVAARGGQAVDLRLEAYGPAGLQSASGRYLMATVCAIGLHAGGLIRFTDQVVFDDGLMDLWAFAGEGYGAALAHAARVWRGKHRQHPGVIRLTGDRFDIYTSGPQAAHLDGEPRSVPDLETGHLAVQVVPRCLRVLAPMALARRRYAAYRS
jgi:diacylglycerol kinase family enzyme